MRPLKMTPEKSARRLLLQWQSHIYKCLWRITTASQWCFPKAAHHFIKQVVKRLLSTLQSYENLHSTYSKSQRAGSCDMQGVFKKLSAQKKKVACQRLQLFFLPTGTRHPCCLAPTLKTIHIFPTSPFLSIPSQNKNIGKITLPQVSPSHLYSALYTGRM